MEVYSTNQGDPVTQDDAVTRVFGRVLQEARRTRGISQEELAFDCGLHRTYISLLERGRKSPTLTTLAKLGTAIGVPASELIRRVETVLMDLLPPN